jgi:N-methylhydantoinase A
MSLRVATDIGGTFTDLAAFDEESGLVRVAKASTTPRDFSRGVLDAVGVAELDLADAGAFVHGCTVVINAITERTGARTALVTTRGFRDVLEIGRGNRPDMYNLVSRKPVPFVPRRLRFEVTERVDRRGRVLEPLRVEELEDVAAACRAQGVESVAICFLHAYAHPEHEQACREELGRLLPEAAVTISSEITREWREYERTSTTVLNAYVRPVVERYLSRLDDDLRREGLPGSLAVMQSNGGTASFDAARRLPVYLVESGPAAGIIAAARLGEQIGEPNVISLDIGGTTAKCSLIEAGRPKTTTEYRLEWQPGYAGYPAMVPVVDIVEIGAGGGSLAWLDGGRLRVGPSSAGAEPGPACYGNGGVQATVTDAKLLAGVINPEYFLGGRLRVHPELARAALRALGLELGLTPEETANGVIRLANAAMINALKLVSVRRGHDPRDFALVACGGGGPMHAAALASELGVTRVVVPSHPGHFSAWGMLVTEPRVDLLRTQVTRLDAAEPLAVEEAFRSLEQEAVRRLRDEGAGPTSTGIGFRRAADMRYAGQEHTVVVPVVGGRLSLAALAAGFHRAHARSYTFELPDVPVEIVTFHLTATRTVELPQPRELPAEGRSAAEARKATRVVDFDADGEHECAVYERDLLPPGFASAGPLIVEEPAATTLVHPEQALEIDRFGNLIVRLG